MRGVLHRAVASIWMAGVSAPDQQWEYSRTLGHPSISSREAGGGLKATMLELRTINGATPAGGAVDDLAVEVTRACLNLADQFTALRTALTELARPDAPADEPDLDGT